MRIYIGCGLTHVPRELFHEYTDLVKYIASALEQAHVVKYALRDSDPQLATRLPTERARLCYSWDRSMVEAADVMVADVSFSSTGLGIEMQIAESLQIPIVLCWRDWGDNASKPAMYETPDRQSHQLQIAPGPASLMVLGIPNVLESVEYFDAHDAGVQLMDVMTRLGTSKGQK